MKILLILFAFMLMQGCATEDMRYRIAAEKAENEDRLEILTEECAALGGALIVTRHDRSSGRYSAKCGRL